MSDDPLEGLAGDLVAQRAFVEPRAPVYARLIDLLGPSLDGPAGDRLREAWAGREFGPWYERPLLLLSALRYDALREGASHPLWSALASPDPDPEAATAAALESALAPDRHHLWQVLTTRFVQTNETSRALAWIWPAAVLAEAEPERPLALVDVGASAGLNLVADRLPPVWERSDGRPLDLEPLPPIATREGYDLRPVDVLEEEDARWLLACVWPGQEQRAERLGQAIAAFRELAGTGEQPRVQAASASEVPARLPTADASGQRVLVYQTIMRDYLPDEEREDYLEGMRRWLEGCPAGSATWAELEVTTKAREGGAPVDLTAHLPTVDGIRSLLLAHCEPHPRVIEVFDGALEELRRLLSKATG